MKRNTHSAIVTTITFYLGLVQAVLVSVSGISVIADWNPVLPGVLLAISTVLAAIQASADRYVQERVVPEESVVEYKENGFVYAGAGADLNTPYSFVRDENSPYDPNHPTHEVR